MQLQVYDQEPESCQSKLFEYKVTFPPRFERLFVYLPITFTYLT